MKAGGRAEGWKGPFPLGFLLAFGTTWSSPVCPTVCAPLKDKGRKAGEGGRQSKSLRVRATRRLDEERLDCPTQMLRETTFWKRRVPF